jgi:hypothetical protein
MFRKWAAFFGYGMWETVVVEGIEAMHGKSSLNA